MQNDPTPIHGPSVRLRRTGARRASEPARPRSVFGGKAPAPKGKNVTVALMFVLVIAGFFLQLNWMQRAKQNAEIPPDGFAAKLGQWMLNQKGAGESAATGAPGVENIECDRCFGTGGVLSPEGKREACPICMGVGSRLIRRLDPADYKCPACGGMGRMVLPDSGVVGTCPRCEGRGLIRRGGGTADAAE